MRNSSIITADRTTHLKIVAVALLGSIAVMVVGIAARPQVDTPASMQVMKAVPAMLATGGPVATIR